MTKKQHKVTIDAGVLNDILTLVAPSVEERTSNVYARSYLIDVTPERIIVRGNNSLIEAVYTYKGKFELQGEPIVFCVDNFIRQIIGKLKKDISFVFSKGDAVIKAGRKKHEIALQDVSNYPDRLDIPEDIEKIEDLDAYMSAFNRTNFAVSNLPDSKPLQTFRIVEGTILTSNRDQGVLLPTDFKVSANPPATQFMSALKASGSVIKNEDTDELWVALSKDVLYVKFVFEDGELEYNVAPLEGEYPERIKEVLDEALELEPALEFVIEKEDLRETLSDCLLYYDKASVVGQSPGMRIEWLKGNKLNFSIHIEDLSRFDSVVNLEVEPKGQEGFAESVDPKDLMSYVEIYEGPFTFKFFDPDESPVFLIDDEQNPEVRYMQVTMVDNREED